jgi:hypothetical protein
MIDVVKNRHGTYYARRKVPKELEGSTAQVLGVAKDHQSWLKRSLGTKDVREANVPAKPVQQEFDRILDRARALLKERPKRERLREPILCRLALRDRKTDLALRVAPIQGRFHTAWATSRHRLIF